MEDKFNKERDILNTHFGVMPKLTKEVCKAFYQQAEEFRKAMDKLAEASRQLSFDTFKNQNRNPG